MDLTSRGLIFYLTRTRVPIPQQCRRDHVSRVLWTSIQRSFISRASRAGAEIHTTALHDSKDLESRKCLMISSSLPSITKYQDVLDQLAKLPRKSSADFISGSTSSFVILTTPTFSSWLENSEFMRKLLHVVFTRDNAAVQIKFTVNALLAVVDGLPPTIRTSSEPAIACTEGFAIMHGRDGIFEPGSRKLEDGVHGSIQSQRQRSSIIFSMPLKSDGENFVEVTVPLANTMFHNGRTSTLLLSKWQRTKESSSFEKLEQSETNSAKIFPSSPASTVSMFRDVPVVPLTPPRQVASGLGNIIRQILNADGKAVSASQELEASVESYREVRKLPKQIVVIWALVISESAMLSWKADQHVQMDTKMIQDAWTRERDPGRHSYVGDWLQKQGVSLRRVLSGGGGWGLKQGLLSLDPETTLMEAAEARHDFDLSGSIEKDQVRALGNIAKPGSWVQFLIPELVPFGSTLNEVYVPFPMTDSGTLNALTFGCMPSTVDDLPQPSSDPSTWVFRSDAGAIVEGFEGRFGAQSEAGIFIYQNENGMARRSKIDVPFSSFGWAT